MTMDDMQMEWWKAAEECDGERTREIVRSGGFQPGWRRGAECETPLTFAVKTENLEIAEHVCEAAAMPPSPSAAEIWKKGTLDACNMEGKAALHLAAAMDFELGEGFIQALMGAGADMEKADSNGKTALDIADSIGNMGAVDLLSGIGTDETDD